MLHKIFYIIFSCATILKKANAAPEIRGVPGKDYPTYTSIVPTSFKCSEQPRIPGYYADPETRCQIFHYCHGTRKESFLCPPGTIFSEAILSCDYWYSSVCNFSVKKIEGTKSDSELNLEFNAKSFEHGSSNSSDDQEVPEGYELLSWSTILRDELSFERKTHRSNSMASASTEDVNFEKSLEDLSNYQLVRRTSDGTIKLRKRPRRPLNWMNHVSTSTIPPLPNSPESDSNKATEIIPLSNKRKRKPIGSQFEKSENLAQNLRSKEHENEFYVVNSHTDIQSFEHPNEDISLKLLPGKKPHDGKKINNEVIDFAHSRAHSDVFNKQNTSENFFSFEDQDQFETNDGIEKSKNDHVQSFNSSATSIMPNLHQNEELKLKPNSVNTLTDSIETTKAEFVNMSSTQPTLAREDLLLSTKFPEVIKTDVEFSTAGNEDTAPPDEDLNLLIEDEEGYLDISSKTHKETQSVEDFADEQLVDILIEDEFSHAREYSSNLDETEETLHEGNYPSNEYFSNMPESEKDGRNSLMTAEEKPQYNFEKGAAYEVLHDMQIAETTTYSESTTYETVANDLDPFPTTASDYNAEHNHGNIIKHNDILDDFEFFDEASENETSESNENSETITQTSLEEIISEENFEDQGFVEENGITPNIDLIAVSDNDESSTENYGEPVTIIQPTLQEIISEQNYVLSGVIPSEVNEPENSQLFSFQDKGEALMIYHEDENVNEIPSMKATSPQIGYSLNHIRQFQNYPSKAVPQKVKSKAKFLETASSSGVKKKSNPTATIGKKVLEQMKPFTMALMRSDTRRENPFGLMAGKISNNFRSLTAPLQKMLDLRYPSSPFSAMNYNMRSFASFLDDDDEEVDNRFSSRRGKLLKKSSKLSKLMSFGKKLLRSKKAKLKLLKRILKGF